MVGPTNSTSGGFVLPIVTVGAGPWGIAANPVTNKIYVACTNSNYPFGMLPHNQLAVPVHMPGYVFVIDGNNKNITSSIQVGMYPKNIVVNSVTNMIYVTNEKSNSVSVIDGQTNNVIKTISVASQPEGIGLDTVSNKIYVANSNSSSISVIDGANNQVIDTINLENIHPQQVAVNYNMHKVYVTDGNTDTVIVLDGYTDKVQESIPAGINTQYIAVNKVTNKIYVSGPSTTLAVIDGLGNKVLNTVKIGGNSTAIAVNDVTNRVYVTNTTSNVILVIDGSTGKYLQQLDTTATPYGITVNQNTGKVYTSIYYTGYVWISGDSSSHASNNSVYVLPLLNQSQSTPLNQSQSTPLNQSQSTPLKIFKKGISVKDIMCNGGLHLIIKAEDGSPACVKPDTAQKLVERGWAKPTIDQIT